MEMERERKEIDANLRRIESIESIHYGSMRVVNANRYKQPSIAWSIWTFHSILHSPLPSLALPHHTAAARFALAVCVISLS